MTSVTWLCSNRIVKVFLLWLASLPRLLSHCDAILIHGGHGISECGLCQCALGHCFGFVDHVQCDVACSFDIDSMIRLEHWRVACVQVYVCFKSNCNRFQIKTPFARELHFRICSSRELRQRFHRRDRDGDSTEGTSKDFQVFQIVYKIQRPPLNIKSTAKAKSAKSAKWVKYHSISQWLSEWLSLGRLRRLRAFLFHLNDPIGLDRFGDALLESQEILCQDGRWVDPQGGPGHLDIDTVVSLGLTKGTVLKVFQSDTGTGNQNQMSSGNTILVGCFLMFFI